MQKTLRHHFPLLILTLPLTMAVAQLSCSGSQQATEADFWQEALPEPIAVLDPWISTPTSARLLQDVLTVQITEIAPFVKGPREATGAEHTLIMHDPLIGERRLHLRLAPGQTVPFHRGETVKLQVFSRLDEHENPHHSLLISARRPLGTGADFRPVLIVASPEDLIPPELLPRMLTGLMRTEQIAYREVVAQGECGKSIAHYFAAYGDDTRSGGVARRKRQILSPGSKTQRVDQHQTYEVTIFDVRRSTSTLCPTLDESVLAWMAVWLETPEAQKHATALPEPVTPTHAVEEPHQPTRTDALPQKPKKPHKPTQKPEGLKP